MSKFTELPKTIQAAVLAGLMVLITVGGYFGYLKRISDQTRISREKLQATIAENQQLLPYEVNMGALERQIESLKQQLASMERIVPDEKAADQFMHLMQTTASNSGIEIRRYTAKPSATREFYTEVPFDLELDGPYYSVLTFFERVGQLDRIINVGNLQVGGLDAKNGKRGNYDYAPRESVVVHCTATTFFSHEEKPAEPAKKRGRK
jgi:type IV pilus assembly protein PilO